jgi:hypothetical protein
VLLLSGFLAALAAHAQSGSSLQFLTVAPCRIMDTRNPNGPLGGPFIAGGTTRTIPIPSSACGIPTSASAYSLNFTFVPRTGELAYLSVWPTGQAQPLVSTLNSLDGSVIANAAIVPAGTAGAINTYGTNDTDLIVDINGYFAPPAANTLQFYTLPPCRVLDTRNANGTLGGPSIPGGASRSFPIPSSSCGVPASAAAYSLNVTVVPQGALGYLTAWPTGQTQPAVSTLNSFDGTVLANAAIVPAGTGGAASFYASNTTDLVVDINGYFAPPGSGGLNFYPVTPCRLVDTRNPSGPFGGPTFGPGTTRTFPLSQGSCGLPGVLGAQAYSLNITVVPQGVLSYLSTWPAGGAQPVVSTLNAFKGQVVANAAIVPAGQTGSIDVYVTNATDVIIDTNGYFGPGGTSGGAANIQIISGNSQTTNVGQTFAVPLTVKVADAQGNSLSSIPVTWTVSQGSATISSASTSTGANGQASTNVTAGSLPGAVVILASTGTLSTQFSLTVIPASSTQSITLYVAPNGNDLWSGTLPAPDSTNTDGPFATLDHARAFVQSIAKAGLNQINVQFRAGTYFLSTTEMFTAADSGSATTQIVYQNYPGESPVFSGGVRVQNWTNTGGDTWKTTLPAATKYFENLFYNRVRRLRPRLGGYLGTYYRYVGPIYLSTPGPPAKTTDPNCSVYFAGSGWECYDRFQYAPTDPIVNTWKNLAPAAGNHCGQPPGNPALAGDIELVNFEQYSVSKLRFSCVDTVNHIAYLTGTTAIEADHPTAHGFIPDHRYLVENVQDQLTQPGQWFLDRSTTPWTLTYLANPGENPNTDTVIVPQLTQVLVASNLQYVTFQGLTFANDNYTMPATGYDGSSDIIASLSFQNSQHITFNSNIVTQTSEVGLEFISCIDQTSLNWCASFNASGVAANNLIENSAFYELAADAIRIGTSGSPTDSDANVPQFHTVQNNVVEGYGRVYPSSKAITQGQGHDNLYTHNDIYDGYKGAIHVCYCANSDANPPFTNNNVISFNHVYNLFQGLMNDSGSLYFGVGTPSPPSSGTGNKMLNNRVHDVSDASVWDSDGYGGDGLYADDFSGLVDMENNLVYRVSGNAISFSGPRAGPNQSSTVANNILAFARQSLLNSYDPYSFNTVPPLPLFFTAANNLFYFDRNAAESFYAQGGCTYAGEAFTAYEQWTSNLYWRTDGEFASDPRAFHVQQSLDASGNCGNNKLWTYYTFSGWQGLGEDVHGVVQNPGFKNPAYPADDYSLPNGSPGVGFVVFDPSQAGRSNPVIMPPAVPATFPTKTFNPATDF